jgi:hypothetical protein
MLYFPHPHPHIGEIYEGGGGGNIGEIYDTFSYISPHPTHI